jgi:nucleoside-diphosphate-sugar epimerase
VIAVTGATGFIGRHLVATLAARGEPVRAIVRPESRRRPPAEAAEVRHLDLTDDHLAEAFEGVDAVVHLAGCVRSRIEDEFRRSNVEATRGVARAARRAGVRLIHISSLAAAGPAPPSSPRDETQPAAPITAYGRSKLAGEEIVTSVEGLRWTILRPGVVYGPQDAAVLTLFRMADRGILPLVGRATAAYMFIHIDDMIRVIEAALARPVDGRIVFVGHATPVTPRALFDHIRAAVGRPAVIVPVPLAITRAAAALCEVAAQMTGRLLPLDRWRYAELASEGFVCRVDRLHEWLGVRAEIDLPEGLARTAAWYRAQGLLRAR